MRKIYWAELTTTDFVGLDPEKTIAVLPVAAIEQHGPHLPLGTDALLASAISADVAARVGGLVEPALSYGYKSQPKCGGGQHFCGTTSLDGATLSALVRDAVREFHRHGVRRLVLVLGVLAVLITIVVVSVSGIERGTTERDCRSERRQLKASVEEYKVTLGAYPPDDAALEAFNVLDASAHPN